MNLRRTTLGAFLVLALMAVLVILLGPPSEAEPKKLLVSTTASGPFRDNLATPLFQGAGPFVPLDESSTSFYVKNNSKQTARATLAVVNRGGINRFEQALTVGVDIDGTTTTSTVPAPGSPACSLVTTGPNIAPGGVQGIDIALAVADLQEQVGMDQAASLDFVVTLSQVSPRGQIRVCGEQAAAQPEVQGVQDGDDGSGDRADCDRDVVVTVMGDPTCVPTMVDAGATYGEDDPRSTGTVGALAALALTGGAAMVVWAGRRRRVADA